MLTSKVLQPDTHKVREINSVSSEHVECKRMLNAFKILVIAHMVVIQMSAAWSALSLPIN